MIYDFDKYATNERNGTYGGKAGSKEGITIDGEYWIIKYPQSTKGMRGEVPSYSSSPLSEYLGSHIYELLGVDVHETRLGMRNGKLVVGCKDFCKKEGSLRELRTLKNVYNETLAQKLEESFSSTSTDEHLSDLPQTLLHLRYNPVLQIPDIQERFWDMFVIDILINNNDRNNGNWGLLYEDGKYTLAPVFDNGAAFSNKLTDEKISSYVNDSEKLRTSVYSCATVYGINDKQVFARDILTLADDYDGLRRSLIRNVPIINERFDIIENFINGIPSKISCGGKEITVFSDVRKQFYIKTIKERINSFLQPAYEKALETVLKNKLCKCNFTKKNVNTKNTAKTGQR